MSFSIDTSVNKVVVGLRDSKNGYNESRKNKVINFVSRNLGIKIKDVKEALAFEYIESTSTDYSTVTAGSEISNGTYSASVGYPVTTSSLILLPDMI